jgi:hypothetical protein
MPKYLVLLYEDETPYQSEGSESVWAEVGAMHDKFQQNVGAAILGGNALQPQATATSIRDSGATVTDGPFVETKEVLGGFYLIEAADLDEAIAIGKQCPAPYGGVEVRPILELS